VRPQRSRQIAHGRSLKKKRNTGILTLFQCYGQAKLYNKNPTFNRKILILFNSFILKIFNPDFADSKLPKNMSFYSTTLVYHPGKMQFLSSLAVYLRPSACIRKAE
jgi:hypothetical protein